MPSSLAAIVAVLTFIGLAATASASTSITAETRVGASAVVVAPAVGPPQHITAGQQLGNDGQQVIQAVVTGVAAKAGAKACSFAGATTVLMADGSRKPIEDVEVGDKVIATDPETGEQEAKTVEHIFVHDDTVIDLVVDGEVITTTEDHPFWSVTDQRFERADELEAGEQVLGADGREVTVSGLHVGTAREVLAYNLSVEGIHTYHVGAAEVLVHNECSILGRRIAKHSLDEGHKIPGLDTPELLGRYVDDITSIPGTPATRGRTVWWDNDRGLIIVRQGDGGTVFKPDRGYQYFRDQILE